MSNKLKPRDVSAFQNLIEWASEQHLQLGWILKTILERYPQPVSIADLAQVAEVQPTGSAIAAFYGRLDFLRSKGYVTYNEPKDELGNPAVRAIDLLFPLEERPKKPDPAHAVVSTTFEDKIAQLLSSPSDEYSPEDYEAMLDMLAQGSGVVPDEPEKHPYFNPYETARKLYPPEVDLWRERWKELKEGKPDEESPESGQVESFPPRIREDLPKALTAEDRSILKAVAERHPNPVSVTDLIQILSISLELVAHQKFIARLGDLKARGLLQETEPKDSNGRASLRARPALFARPNPQ